MANATQSNCLLEAPFDNKQISDIAKALSHPARIEIIRMLYERQSCIGCDIVDQVGLAQSTTSEHLRILKVAGIITGEIEHPRVCYSLNPTALEPIREFFNIVGVAKTASRKL